MKSKLKIYFHNTIYLKVRRQKVPGPNIFARFLKTAASFSFNFLFQVGMVLLHFWKKTAQFFLDLKAAVKRKEYIKSFAIFLGILIICLASFNAAPFLAKGLELKKKVLQTLKIGTLQFNLAQEALKQQNFSQAENNFTSAYQSFQSGQKELASAQGQINKIINLIPAKKDAENILKTAEILALAGKEFSSFTATIQKFKISSSGLEAQGLKADELLEISEAAIAGITDKLLSAKNYISETNENNLPKEYQAAFLDARQKIVLLEKNFSQLKDIFYLLKGLFFGKKEILVLFENNNELRATGGFMGSYGSLEFEQGNIKSIKIGSIYDLDGQLKEIITPPYPILNLNNRWYLRDSNWFADFPESAQKIISFYEKEGGETPDAVIALTPNLIIDLLRLTGPVEIPKNNVVLTADNFIEITQVSSILNQDAPENQPKQILADLFPILLQRLSNLKAGEWQMFLESLQQNLAAKQIVLFAKEKKLQNQISTFNWGGEIKKTDRDFLEIVSSNLEGTKTDLYTKQEIKLKSKIENDGSIINELTLTRTNLLPKLDKTYNTSFIRIFAPLGSSLVSSTGFDYKNLDTKLLSGQKTDADVFEWERKSVKDIVTGTAIGQEAGKTFFGNWLTVEGGQSKTVKLTYRLPFKIQGLDHYSLMLQKQIGSQNENFEYNLDFSGRDIKWQNFSPQNTESNNLTINQGLNKDYFFGFVLKKR